MSERTRQWIATVLIAAGVLLAYANSLGAAWVFDDHRFLAHAARHPWPQDLRTLLGTSLRPVTDLTLTLNYAAGGADPRGYHVVNLLIHLLAALALFGCLHQTLQRLAEAGRFRGPALGLAAAASLLWAVHPLQTQSVTYVSQRAEALMGLWALLVLYSVIRSHDAPHSGRWQWRAVLACALGMATKPVMVVAPLAITLYDRVFLARSWADVWRRRGRMYLGLASTWLLLAGLLSRLGAIPEPSAGFGMERMSAWEYAATQPGVILHYLRLAVWPDPLVFHYGWPIARTADAVLPPLLGLGMLLAAAGWAWRRAPAIGWVAAWCVLTLAPSSSAIPIADPAYEYRMYLPLAGLVALAVIGVWAALARLPVSIGIRQGLGMTLAAAAVLGYGAATVRRNAVYRSELVLWGDVLRHRPGNPVAHINLGKALALAGQPDAAARHYAEAVRLEPGYAEAYNNWALLLQAQGDGPGAKQLLRQALMLKPDWAELHYNLGNLLAHDGRLAEASAAYARALELEPRLVEAHTNWGNVLLLQGDVAGAESHYRRALALNPLHADARRNLVAIQGRGR